MKLKSNLSGKILTATEKIHDGRKSKEKEVQLLKNIDAWH